MKTRLLIILVIGMIIGFTGNLAFAQSDDYTVGKVQFPDRCYSSVGTGTVIIIDPDMNQNSNQEESIPIQLWSSRDTDVRTPNAIETGLDTGIFEATVFFNMYNEAFSQRIRVFEGDTLHAKYIDTTVPIETQREIEAFVVMGTLPPNQKFGKYWESLSIPHDSKYVYDTCMAEFIAEIKPTDYALNALDIIYPAPLKQIESGLYVDEVLCKDNLIPITKYDGSPACVTSETQEKLMQRGWVENSENVLSSKSTENITVEELLIQNHIDYLPDRLVVAGGLSIMGDSGCGAVIDIDSQTHWFVIDSILDPKKITFLQETPQMCKVNTGSCYCDVHRELTALTLNELSYFTSAEQEKYSEILIEYLYDQNINRTPKFQIGKLNLNYTDSSAIGYCGAIWGTNTYGFFDGAIVNNVVQDYGISKKLPLLCAISDDAKWWVNEN